MLLSVVPIARVVTPGQFTKNHLIDIIVSIHLFLEVKKIIGYRKVPGLQIEILIFRSQLSPGIVLRRQLQVLGFGLF